MKINQLSKVIVDHSVRIHSRLGPGLLESVYQRILAYELRRAGLVVETEVGIPIEWDGHVISEGFRADLIVDGRILVELKSVEEVKAVHLKQTLTYTKLSGLNLGLLINFGEPLLKNGIHRLVHQLKE